MISFIATTRRTGVRAAGAIAVVFVISSSPAAAEPFVFDWGGEKVVEGSGREAVKLAVAKKPGDIIVSFGDRKLYLVTASGTALSYPIAVPREQSRWQGTIAVTSKRENPSWTPTPSMRAENPKLPSWVPGGHPMNPLGQRALYLGSSTYRIHGTDAPWTIGSAVSKGCVRMYNKDAADLYQRVSVGASVLVTWEKFKSTADEAAVIPPQPSAPIASRGQRTPRSASIETGSLPSKPSRSAPPSLQADAETPLERNPALVEAPQKVPTMPTPQLARPKVEELDI
jgi:lipoprotein-anchoring transpeptidase ErfK/SrfK